MSANFDPIAFHFLIDVRWYGLAYVFALGWLWWFSARQLRNRTEGSSVLTIRELDILLFWIALGVIGGGRLGYFLTHYGSYDLTWLLSLSKGGMSSFGAMGGVLLVTSLFCATRGISIPKTLDILALGAPIGILIVRIANLVNDDLDAESSILEGLFEGLIPFITLYVASQRWMLSDKPGLTTGLFALYYAIVRLGFQSLRGGDAQQEFLIVLALSAVLAICAFIFIGTSARSFNDANARRPNKSRGQKGTLNSSPISFSRLRTSASILCVSIPLAGCGSGNRADIPNVGPADPVTVELTNPGGDSTNCACANSQGAYLSNSSSAAQNATYVIYTKNTSTGEVLTPQYGTVPVPPGKKTAFMGCSIFAPATSCRFQSTYQIAQSASVRVATGANAARYGAVASPSIATCTSWCSDSNNPHSGACLNLGVRYGTGLKPLADMVAQARASGGTVKKADIIAQYGVPADFDKCDRGDITTVNGKLVNEGKQGEYCIIPSEDLPKSITDKLKIAPSSGSSLKLLTAIPRLTEATPAGDIAAAHATNVTTFDMKATAPMVVFDGAGGAQVTEQFGGTVLGTAHIELPNLPKQTIVATSNGCLAIDEP